MKKLLFIALLASLANLAACQNSGSDQQNATNTQSTIKSTIPADEFDKKLSTTANVQLIDVRTPEEFAGGHLKNAVNINIRDNDFDQQIAKLDKKKPVMVYCKAGSRSAAAADKMQEMGFSEIYNLDGGIMKWESAGKPTEGGAANRNTGMAMDTFNKMVAQSKYVLVDYNAQWCAPCKKMLPVLESLAAKKKDKLSLLKIDADDNKELLKLKGISSIPYLELYQDGKLIWKHDGFIEEDQLLKETKL